MRYQKIKNLLKKIFLSLIYYAIGKHLKKKSAKYNNLKDYVNISLSYKFPDLESVYPLTCLAALQIQSEIIEFCKILIERKPKIILEIGTANGGTLFLLSRIAGENSIIFSIDLAVESSPGIVDYKPPIFYKSFALNNQKMIIIKGNSHDRAILNQVIKYLNKREIDLLFIDGDHTYKGVKKDFQMYGPLVKENGIIAFHDIVKVPDDYVDVHKFWNEIKNKYNHMEIVEDWNQERCGFGIIIKKKINQ
jgi:cephalosporin hydroxylase